MKLVATVLAAVVFLAACGVPQEEHKAVADKLSECETRLEEATATNEGTQNELGAVTKQLDELRAELQAKSDALLSANEKAGVVAEAMASAEAIQEELKGSIAKLEAELKKATEELADGQKRVAETKDRADKAEVDLETCRTKLSMYRSDAGVDGDAIDSSQNPMAAEYAQFLNIQVTAARYIDTYTQGRVPGLRFLVKNNGKRSVSLLKVMVYFQGVDGATIGEKDVYLVHNKGFEPTGILRPNYSIKVPGERDKYMTAAHITDSWKKGAVDVKVVEIEFEE